MHRRGRSRKFFGAAEGDGAVCDHVVEVLHEEGLGQDGQVRERVRFEAGMEAAVKRGTLDGKMAKRSQFPSLESRAVRGGSSGSSVRGSGASRGRAESSGDSTLSCTPATDVRYGTTRRIPVTPGWSGCVRSTRMCVIDPHQAASAPSKEANRKPPLPREALRRP